MKKETDTKRERQEYQPTGNTPTTFKEKPLRATLVINPHSSLNPIFKRLEEWEDCSTFHCSDKVGECFGRNLETAIQVFGCYRVLQRLPRRVSSKENLQLG